MQIPLQILTPAGTAEPRIVQLALLYADGTCYLRAVDGRKPSSFFLRKAHFPWGEFHPRLLGAWKSGRPVPPAFALRRRLPAELLANLELLPLSAFLTAVVALRKAGFLPPLPALDANSCPREIPWQRVPELILSTANS